MRIMAAIGLYCWLLVAAFAQSIPFPGPGGIGSGTTASIAYQTTAIDSTAQTTYTFTGLATGTATATRFIIACYYVGGGTVGNISSATIAGSAATALVTNNTQSQAKTACFGLTVTTGTTATFTVVVAAAGARAAVAVYRADNLVSTTPDATASATTGNPISATLTTVHSSGFAVAMADGNYTNTTAISWSGVTLDVTSSVGSTPYSSASQFYGATQTNLVVSATLPGSPANQSLAALSMH